MTTIQRRKTGRPLKHVIDPRTGKVIAGLARTPFKRDSLGNVTHYRYYVQSVKPYVWLGFELDEAVTNLEVYRCQQTGQSVTWVTREQPRPPVETFITVTDNQTGKVDTSLTLTEDSAWAFLRQLVTSDPTKAQRMLGVQFRNLDELQPPLSLGQCWSWYENRRSNKCHPDWKLQQKRRWDEFARFLGVGRVDDITREHVDRYYHRVMDSGKSPAYIRNRFDLVKGVMKVATTRHPEAVRVYKLVTDKVSGLVSPAKEESNPTPISREHYTQILDAAKDDTLMSAALLLGLNMCGYAKCLIDVKASDIDMHTGLLRTVRVKTRTKRCSFLWPRTIEALKKLMAQNCENDPRLFQVTEHAIMNRFRRYADKLGLPSSVKFSGLRDAAYTVAGRVSVDASCMLAGHKFNGEVDKYLQREPQHIQNAVDTIEKAYFG